MPTFPALDEEPPPRPVWKVLVMVTAGIVAVAAVVVVAVEHPWSQAPGQASVRLELRTPGHRSLLATTAGLAVQIGLPPTLPHRVAARFSPDGSMVAVTLDQLTPGGRAAHGLILLTRGATGVYSTDRKVTGPVLLKPKNRYALAWQAGKVA